MKKSAFVLGYTGGILALVFSLLMIYLVPVNIFSKAVEDIKYAMKNENIVALNEVGLYAANHPDDPITDYSENGLINYASKTAEQSNLEIDEAVYEDTMVFVHDTAFDGIFSMALVGVSIIFAILAFIGSLAVRKHPSAGAVLMLVSSLILLLSAIYTGTLIPMIIASAVLAAAGIFAFIPARQPLPAAIHARNRQKPQNVMQEQPYPQQAMPGYVPNPQQPQAQPGYTQPPQAPAQASGTPEAGVPFPDEDVQVFTPPADTDDEK